MKKYFSILAVFAMILAASSLVVSCGEDFDDDVNNGNVDNGNVEVSVVGVWECTDYDWETDYPETVMMEIDIQIGEKVCFNSDGTYSTENGITGKWKRNGNYLNIIQNAAYAIAFDYTIEKLTSTEMVLYGDMQIAKVKYNFKRVSN